MPRALCLCFAIVAAFQLPAAAAAVEDIPIPPSVAALADRVGVDLAHNRANFLSEIARRYEIGDTANFTAVTTAPDRSRMLTAGELYDAAQTYFNTDRYVKVILKPER